MLGRGRLSPPTFVLNEQFSIALADRAPCDCNEMSHGSMNIRKSTRMTFGKFFISDGAEWCSRLTHTHTEAHRDGCNYFESQWCVRSSGKMGLGVDGRETNGGKEAEIKQANDFCIAPLLSLPHESRFASIHLALAFMRSANPRTASLNCSSFPDDGEITEPNLFHCTVILTACVLATRAIEHSLMKSWARIRINRQILSPLVKHISYKV